MLDQLLVGAAPGDAITRNMLLLHHHLATLGPSDIFSEHLEPGLTERVRPLDELPDRANPGRPLVFHTSMGSWPAFRAASSVDELIIVHHNFSPWEPYVEFAPQVAGDLVRGPWEMEQLRDRVVLTIADSEFNADQLREVGYTDIHVVAPTPDVDRLNRTLPDPAMLGRISSWGPGPLVLCVAQQLPHKRIERVIAAVAVLQQEHLPTARLAVVGVERFPRYSAGLRAFAETVGITGLQMLGRISDAELSALYLRAGAFLTLTEHEGFCVPAVEAMATGVPVVASARAALPATVGDAGLLVDDPDDPVLAADIVHRVLSDTTLRHVLVGRGVSRARQLSAAATLPALVGVIERAVPDLTERKHECDTVGRATVPEPRP